MPVASDDGVQSRHIGRTGRITIQYVADQSYSCEQFIYPPSDQWRR